MAFQWTGGGSSCSSADFAGQPGVELNGVFRCVFRFVLCSVVLGVVWVVLVVAFFLVVSVVALPQLTTKTSTRTTRTTPVLVIRGGGTIIEGLRGPSVCLSVESLYRVSLPTVNQRGGYTVDRWQSARPSIGGHVHITP